MASVAHLIALVMLSVALGQQVAADANQEHEDAALLQSSFTTGAETTARRRNSSLLAEDVGRATARVQEGSSSIKGVMTLSKGVSICPALYQECDYETGFCLAGNNCPGMDSRCRGAPGSSSSQAPTPDAEPLGPGYTWLNGYDGKGSECTGDFEMDRIEKETKAFVYQDGVFSDCPGDVTTFHLKFEDVSEDGGPRCWELPTGKFSWGDEERECAGRESIRRWGLELVPKTVYYTYPCRSAVIAFWEPRPNDGRLEGCGRWNYVGEYNDCSDGVEDQLSRDEDPNFGAAWLLGFGGIDENAKFMNKVYVIQCDQDEEYETGAACTDKVGITDFSESGCPYKLLSSVSAKKKGCS